MKWTAEMCEMLSELKHLGLTNPDIAERMSLAFGILFTKDMVRTKFSRQGLTVPAKKPIHIPKRTCKTEQHDHQGGIELLKLGTFDCRWEVTGSKDSHDWRFCGKSVDFMRGSGSYCTEHAQRAYVKSKYRRKH